MIRQATSDEIATWDKFVAQNPDGGHILQSYEWSKFKKSVGWEPNFLVYEQPGFLLYFCLAVKPASFLGNIYYCAKGPGLFKNYTTNDESRAHLRDFITEIKIFVERLDNKAILVKIEPELLEGEIDFADLRLHKSRADLQQKATILVDISPSEEEILASFKQKTRYNIRLAERKGVVIEQREMSDANVDIMYDLIVATQARAGFSLRRKDYFAGYWQALAKTGLGQLFLATHEGEVLAGVYATRYAGKAYYKDGGSFPIKRNLMAPYLIQWEVMRWAKEMGATSYDLIGSPPKDQLDNPSHPQAGLYQFKRGFNEEVTEFAGCWDIPIYPKKYNIFKSQERAFLKLYNKMTNNIFW